MSSRKVLATLKSFEHRLRYPATTHTIRVMASQKRFDVVQWL